MSQNALSILLAGPSLFSALISCIDYHAGSLCAHPQECAHTSQPASQTATNLQKVLRADGAAAAEVEHTSHQRTRQTAQGQHLLHAPTAAFQLPLLCMCTASRAETLQVELSFHQGRVLPCRSQRPCIRFEQVLRNFACFASVVHEPQARSDTPSHLPLCP